MKLMLRWLPALTLMVFIFYLSSLPGSTVDSLGLGKESYHINGHFLMFFLLGFALFRVTKNVKKSMVLAILYGVFDEIHQKSVPGRTSGLFDIAVDSVGVLLSGVILWRYYHILPKKLQIWLES